MHLLHVAQPPILLENIAACLMNAKVIWLQAYSALVNGFLYYLCLYGPQSYQRPVNPIFCMLKVEVAHFQPLKLQL